MEATPKVHRHRHRRSDSRHHRHERQNNSNSNSSNSNSNSNANTNQQTTTTTSATTTPTGATAIAAATASVDRQQQSLQQQPQSNAINTPVRERRGQRTNAVAATAAAVTAAITNTNTTTTTTSPTSTSNSISANNTNLPNDDNIIAAEEGCNSLSNSSVVGVEHTIITQQHERPHSADTLDDSTSTNVTQTTSQQTVLLVNGHLPPPQDDDDGDDNDGAAVTQRFHVSSTTVTLELSASDGTSMAAVIDGGELDAADACEATAATSASTAQPQLESPTAPNGGAGGGGGGGGGSSRNSSGDALSLRETLQQLPPTVTGHRHRRTHSPQSPARRSQEADASFHRGILGFMDRELKHSSPTPSALSVGSGSAASGGGGSGGGGGSASGGATTRKLQSLSDPQASPAQRSVRSRSSLEKSPRRKRSKSESRRRRERKLIAAGEMEVRQANETLMRYLKQCSEMNDASLSGELEIDQNYDERRVHRKTKSQREKRGHLISKLYTAGGLSSILRELSDDIVPAEGEEIYNPFTPVVSPTEDTPAHIDKMFLQTSSGYRPVEHCYYKHSFVGAAVGGGAGAAGGHGVGGMMGNGGGGSGGGGGSHAHGMFAAGGSIAGGLEHAGMRASSSYGDTRCLLDAECGRHHHEITTNIQLACAIQRIWLLLSNICHGLLAGLALAHLLFVLSSHPMDWSRMLSLAGETATKVHSMETTTMAGTATGAAAAAASVNGNTNGNGATLSDGTQTLSFIEDYATFAEIYLNTFYCLAIVCLVSVFDRMDICRWDLSNATELISFRWLIIAMIYIATIILTICSDSIDERLYYNNNANVTLTPEEMYSNSVMGVWSSLSVTRSIGAICGWIMIGLTPHEDMLYAHLIDLTKYQMINN